jgi:hypothetical protein
VNLIHSILVFWGGNIVHITVRVNLIHFKLVFFLKKINTLQKKHEQCKRIALFMVIALFSEQCN